MYLVDTHILSETGRPQPHPAVVAWLRARVATELHFSVLTFGEIARGIAKQRKERPRYAEKLELWVRVVKRAHRDRILDFDLAAAEQWGLLVQRLGHDSTDLQIAATALTRGLTVVTRNVRHFEPTGVAVFDPFTG